MDYHKEERQSQLMAEAKALLPGHNKDLQKFTKLLVDSMSEVLKISSVFRILQSHSKVSFDEIIQLILSSLQPKDVYYEEIKKLRDKTSQDHMLWPGVSKLYFNLRQINLLRHADLKAINYLLYPDTAPSHQVNDPVSLIELYHSLTEKHVREMMAQAQHTKCFRNYPNYRSVQTTVGALQLPIDAKSNIQIYQIKTAIELAKTMFNHEEGPEFYTFLLRVLSSLLRAIETETPEHVAKDELNQHYNHCLLLRKLPDQTQFQDIMMQVLAQSIPTKSHSAISWAINKLEASRKDLLFRATDESKVFSSPRLLRDTVHTQLMKERYNLYPSYLKTMTATSSSQSAGSFQLFSPSNTTKKHPLVSESSSEEAEQSSKKTKSSS